MMTQPLSLRLFILLAPLMLVVLAACGGDGRETQPTPTPTPTPAPPVSTPFLGLAPDATFGDLMERVPEDERDCVRNNLGEAEYEGLLEQPAFDTDGLDFGERELDPTCFSPETLTGLIVAGIDQQAGGISTETVRCIEGTFSGVDLARVIQQGQDEETSREDIQQVFGAVVPLVLCLTEEEAARVDVGGATGGESQGVTLRDLRCVLQRVDVSVLTDFFAMAGGQQGTPEPEDQQRLMQLMDAFQACGVETADLG